MQGRHGGLRSSFSYAVMDECHFVDGCGLLQLEMLCFRSRIETIGNNRGYMDEREVGVTIIDPDRIEVFIRSSMRDESDFSWSKLRGEINSALVQSDLFKPFVIENHASIEPSASYYLNRLAGSDLAVGIIRSELRAGTNRELRWAIAHKKPLLLIKIGDETTPNIDSLFRYASERDSCT